VKQCIGGQQEGCRQESSRSLAGGRLEAGRNLAGVRQEFRQEAGMSHAADWLSRDNRCKWELWLGRKSVVFIGKFNLVT
jgi:hypothetical protein